MKKYEVASHNYAEEKRMHHMQKLFIEILQVTLTLTLTLTNYSDQSECLVCFFLCTELTLFCTELTLFCTELTENCVHLNQSELRNFFMYIIQYTV